MPNLITIDEAAARIGGRPWDIVRLIEAGAVATATLVDADSLREHQESQ